MTDLTIDFQALRDAWALKAPMPSTDRIEGQGTIDRQANPHNEPYHNKRPRRSEAEIISDLAYAFADTVLMKQYSGTYKEWLEESGYREHWGAMCLRTIVKRVQKNTSGRSIVSPN